MESFPSKWGRVGSDAVVPHAVYCVMVCVHLLWLHNPHTAVIHTTMWTGWAPLRFMVGYLGIALNITTRRMEMAPFILLILMVSEDYAGKYRGEDFELPGYYSGYFMIYKKADISQWLTASAFQLFHTQQQQKVEIPDPRTPNTFNMSLATT